MDQLVYTSLSAMQSLMQKQAVTANNLANANTAGFRGDLAGTQAIYLNSAAGVISARADASGVAASADMKSAATTQTGRDLDVAMDGDALLAVQATDGSEAYTRRGDLQLTDSGLLTTGDGYPVLGDGGPVTLPPADQIKIDKTGAVWIVPQGGDAAHPVQAAQLKLASAAGSSIAKGADGLFHVDGGGALPADPNARVTAGELEGSNVNTTQALTDMIDASRAWETQIKMLKGAQDMDSAATQLMNISDSN